MRVSLSYRNQVKTEEGLALKAYNDGGDQPTIGWGHIKNVHYGDTCTLAQAEAWLTEDLAIAENAVNNLVTVPLTQGQFDVLVSFTMNLGGGALGSSTLLRKLNVGDYASVRSELLRWVYDDPDGAGPLPLHKVQGLVNRRQREADAWLVASAALNPIDPKGSRTINGGGLATTGGLVVAGEQINEVIQNAETHLSAGNVMGIIVGVLILAGGLWAIYARLDDAKLLPWQKKPPAPPEPVLEPATPENP